MRRVTDLVGKAFRETGHAMDRLTLSINENEIFRETFARHRQFMPLKELAPSVAKNAFVAPNAAIIGNVGLLDGSSVWYRSVIRGDKYAIKIGAFSNIQDHAVIQCVSDASTTFPPNTVVGSFVTVGHNAMLTSCLIGDQCLIGQGSVISEGCVVNSGSIIAAGAVLPPLTVVPSKELWAGNPAKFVRKVTDEEFAGSLKSAQDYHELANNHKNDFDKFNGQLPQINCSKC